MGASKVARIVSTAIYIIGVASVLFLGIISLFGSKKAINPDAMLPINWKEQAFMCLAFGTIPMILSCLAVYKFNNIKNSVHKKRDFIFIFIPSFICTACLLFVIGVILLACISH